MLICQELARPLGHALAELQSREWSLKCLQLFTKITLFYRINYFMVLLYRKEGRGQVLSCLPWDILTIVQLSCRVLNSKPGVGEEEKEEYPLRKQIQRHYSSPILNGNAFHRFSCSLILEYDFKDEWNVLGGWGVILSFDWAGPSKAELYEFCLQTFSAVWNHSLSKSVKPLLERRGKNCFAAGFNVFLSHRSDTWFLINIQSQQFSPSITQIFFLPWDMLLLLTHSIKISCPVAFFTHCSFVTICMCLIDRITNPL